MLSSMRSLLALLLCLLLASCSGVPLRSLPRLASLQGQLLDANPAEFMLAIQTDARLVPPPGAVPLLQLAIRPAEPGLFEPIDKTLPMQMTVTGTQTPGLPVAASNRRWLIYTLPPSSQSELRAVQDKFKRIREQRQGQKGGSVAIGIAQDGVAATHPSLADTRWQSWLQVSRRDGFFELWSGTVGELLKQAQAASAPR
jgi:hypothetical protein